MAILANLLTDYIRKLAQSSLVQAVLATIVMIGNGVTIVTFAISLAIGAASHLFGLFPATTGSLAFWVSRLAFGSYFALFPFTALSIERLFDEELVTRYRVLFYAYITTPSWGLAYLVLKTAARDFPLDMH